MSLGGEAEALAVGALEWMVASADDVDHTLYSGGAGVVLALLEAQQHFRDDRYGDAALRRAGRLAAAVDDVEDCSLYFGLAGMAVALQATGLRLGDERAGRAADRALGHVRSRFDGQRWGEMFELLFGNAGIALGALHVGDQELAVLAVEPYVGAADLTPGGVNWAVRPSPARSHHIAHGTLGIVYALAAVGTIEPELAAVATRDEVGPGGFPTVAGADVVGWNEVDPKGSPTVAGADMSAWNEVGPGGFPTVAGADVVGWNEVGPGDSPTLAVADVVARNEARQGDSPAVAVADVVARDEVGPAPAADVVTRNGRGSEAFLALALAGAADVVARNEAGAEGFLVPHSDPPHRPELIERYSYGWCNGPAGDAQVFRLLGAVTGDPAWAGLGDRCWHTVTHSGLPRRLRPGFWDNNGRCCGTAGVLALACDRHVEQGEPLDFAATLVDDLIKRATVDGSGARWSNYEHRETPSVLEPQAGWAMGNAGIIRELLRFARIASGADTAYAVSWPDHPPATAGTRWLGR